MSFLTPKKSALTSLSSTGSRRILDEKLSKTSQSAKRGANNSISDLVYWVCTTLELGQTLRNVILDSLSDINRAQVVTKALREFYQHYHEPQAASKLLQFLGQLNSNHDHSRVTVCRRKTKPIWTMDDLNSGSLWSYAAPDYRNVVAKLLANASDEELTRHARPLAVLVGSGSFNPIHKMHIRAFKLAKQFLETQCNITVLGGLISPSHSAAIRLKLKRNPLHVIPASHRITMCKLAIEDSDWLSVDPWEATRLHMMDYLSLLLHLQGLLDVTLPSLVKRTQIYLFCKFGRLVKLSPSVLRKAGVQCICVCRPLDMEKNTLQLDTRWAGLVTIVEDSAMISADSEATTSSRVRQHLISGRNLKHTLSAPVYKYIFEHRLPNKMMGEEEWNDVDNKVLTSTPTRCQARIAGYMVQQVELLGLVYTR